MKPMGPLKLEGNIAENWRKWKLRWSLYAKASGADKQEEATQCAIFLHTIGEEALEVYDTFSFTEEQKDKLVPIIEKFEAYCSPKKNTTYERYIFNSCTQNGRTIDAFVTDLRSKAKTCEFGDLQDSLIRDRIVCGIDDNNTRERLLRNNALTLEKAIDAVRAAETSKTQTQELNNSVEAAALTNDRRLTNPKYPVKGTRSGYRRSSPCIRCGTNHDLGQCPAFGQTCLKCQGKNHYAKMCFSKKPKDPNPQKLHDAQQTDPNEDSSPDDLFIGEIDALNKPPGNELFVALQVNGEDIRFKIDTGAQCNVIPEHTFAKFAIKPALRRTNTKLTAYGGTRVPIKGKCQMTTKLGSKAIDAEFYVVEINEAKPLIGLQTCRDLELISINNIGEVQENQPDLLAEYDDVFTGLGLVEGEYHIELSTDAKPTIHPPRKVPLSLMPKLQETLEKLTKQGVVSKLDRATDWVNSLVIVEKKDGSLRLCLDPKDLNKAIKREYYKAPTAETISSKLSGMKVFTVIDMSNCYWHKKLDEESSYLCTFNTPFGRYKFNRMPFGVCSASDVAQKMVDDNFSDIPGVLAVHDDIIVAGADGEGHDTALKLVLDRAKERNIKFNRTKIQLRIDKVKYLGSIVSGEGFRPDPDKIKAIVDMPQPQNKQDLQRLLGMVNYLSQYIPNMSEITAPLRSLLKKQAQWSWYDEHDRSLAKIKEALTSSPVLRFFDVNKPATIQADASQNGMGGCLLQEGHPVIYASRSLTSAEENYAQIEKELLAIVFTCERFHQFVYGRKVTVQSDHKPLEAIMTKPLSQAPPRIQRLLIRLQKYQPTVQYVPGKYMFIADTLSRAYLTGSNEQQDISEDIEVMVHSFVARMPATPEKIAELKEETAKDESLQALRKQIIHGWPDHKQAVHPSIAPYWNVRHELSEAEGLLFNEQRVIIPRASRKNILMLIHESHLGVEKCKSRARATVYWPGMSNDIQETVSKCSTCSTYRNRNQKEPMIAHEIPDRPWQKLGSDLFEHKGKTYLLVVDYYSKYIETSLLQDKTAETVIMHMKSIFARHGIPEELVSDNMPYNSREFKDFASSWGFKLTTSSPTYAQSNGLSERAVQTVKRILKKADDPYIGMLEYRNTPVTGMTYSPSQLLMSRTARTKIPATKELLQPCVPTDVRQQLESRQRQQALYYNKGAKPLQPLKANENVRLRQGSTWVPAVVSESANTPRSYIVTTTNGQDYRRNRRDLLQTGEPPHIISGPSQPFEPETEETPPDPSEIYQTSPDNFHAEPAEPEPVQPRVSTRKKVLPSKFKDFVMS